MQYLSILLLFFITVTQASTFEVDNSYTINQRYLKNHQQFSELQRPTLVFSNNIQVDFNLAYSVDKGRELNLDIFRPNTDKAAKATVVLIHGGGWRSGSKSHMYALANKLAQKGYIAIPVEYRLSIEAAYPAGLNDINKAIVWLKKHGNKYGIDTNNIMIAGGSSGGHMAALIAYSAQSKVFKKPEIDTQVAGVIVLDGVLDFTSEMGLTYENKKGDNSAAALWLGGSYEKIPNIWQQASSVYYINDKSPPLLFISSGHLRFQAGLPLATKKLKQFTINVQYYEFDSVPHTFWLFEPWLSTSTDLIDNFITQTLIN